MMRKTMILLVLLGVMHSLPIVAQNYTCSELAEYVSSEYETRDQVTCFNSSMLVKAEYFRLDDVGFVIAYIKSGDYDFYGSPYIFCGISNYTWSSFKSGGMMGSWGKSFHQYIMDNKCNCR
jgi:hypothetical protein